jgi:hypothetical protein
MEKEEREPEVKVTDRRRFSAEGEPVEDSTGETDETTQHADASTTHAESAPDIDERQEAQHAPLPPPTFEVLVLSLRWQAELQLGFYGREKDAEQLPDLEGARHSIDLLGVLQEKTRGNLSLEEQRLLENSLTELRFRYVQAVQELTKPATGKQG